MQLAHNPITKILFEKLKSNGIPNLQNLMFKKDRIKHFEFKWAGDKLGTNGSWASPWTAPWTANLTLHFNFKFNLRF